VNGDKHIEELKRFGQHLKKLREEQTITQEMLANDSDISISQISRIERGIISTSLSQLISISKSLNITLSDLMDF
jgi:transcriptional regulator with XRE-family HTH domain